MSQAQVIGSEDILELATEPHEAAGWIMVTGHVAEMFDAQEAARLRGEGVPLRLLHHEECANPWTRAGEAKEVKVKRKRVRTAHGWRTR